MRMNAYCKNVFKLVAALVVALYIHLWFSKFEDDYMELNDIIASQSDSDDRVVVRNHLTFVSYNMWCNYLANSKSNYVERFKGFANGVKDIDIVLVQEIFIFRVGPLEFSNCASQMVDAMMSQGFKYKTSLTDTVPYVFGQTNGLSIFSKIPLKDVKSVVYKDANPRERPNNKGFVFIRFLVNGKKIAVFNTHTDAHKEKVRALQMAQLTSVISEHQSSHIIAGGDFNINPNNPPDDGNEEEYKNLLKTMSLVGLRAVFTEHEKTHLNGGNYDHFFVSSNVKIEERKVISLLTDQGEMVSDHFGLFMKISLS
ncbi:hypothetical protein QZH41_007029 [Actinostola sp. cb2023]|nr:hypothetical protein QZH41_007029 [Actinostola sp. cb2023]